MHDQFLRVAAREADDTLEGHLTVGAKLTPLDLVHEARAVAVAAGLPAHARPGERRAYAGHIRDIATGLVDSANGDGALLREAVSLAVTEEVAVQNLSLATSALCLAAALTVTVSSPALEAAVVAEGMAAGSADGLPRRRLTAIARLTRVDADVLDEALALVPTGIVSISSIPDGTAVVRDILLAARELVMSFREQGGPSGGSVS
ncbi:MAG: hypothetical protein ACRDZW_02010 [Acidimicrobiales bacterium]